MPTSGRWRLFRLILGPARHTVATNRTYHWDFCDVYGRAAARNDGRTVLIHTFNIRTGDLAFVGAEALVVGRQDISNEAYYCLLGIPLTTG